MAYPRVYGDHTLCYSRFRNGWDHYFLADAFFVSGKSKDRSTKCGCIIVSQDNDALVRGWNDHPRGMRDSDQRRERPEKYVYTEHAERNAIYNAARIGVSLKGSKAYVTRVPCPDCARALIQAGVKEVYACITEDEEAFAERMNTRVSVDMFRECRVDLTLFQPSVYNQLRHFRYDPDL